VQTRLFLITVLLVAATAGTALGADLAPTGTLRAVFLGTNPVQARVNAQTGEVTGPVADLVKELARRLSIPYRLIPAPDARSVIEHLQNGTADVGFLAYEAQRAREVDFAGGFALMLNSFLVRAGSPLQRVADADQPGLRIASVKGQSQQIYLSANLKRASVVVLDAMPPPAEVQRLLVSGELDAFGVNSQRAEEAVAASRAELRVVPGSFMDVEQSFVVKKGEREKATALDAFVDELRASGFIRASLERAKLAGVAVSPARGR